MPTGMHQTAAWAAAGRGRCWHTTSAGAAPGALLGPEAQQRQRGVQRHAHAAAALRGQPCTIPRIVPKMYWYIR